MSEQACNLALAKTMTRLRELNGLTLRGHARHLQMSPATLSRIERGFGCDLATLAQIHEKTGMKYSVLLGEKP